MHIYEYIQTNRSVSIHTDMCTAYYMLTAQSVAMTEEGGKDILDSRGSASGEHRAIGHLRQLHNLTDQQPVRLLTVLSDSSLL